MQFATNYDLILEATESPLEMPSMIQVALETGIGSFVLERCLGSIDDSAASELADLRASFVRGEHSNLPLGRVGPPVTSVLDERLQYRSAQREMLAPLALAAWTDPIDAEPVAVGDLISRKIAKTGSSEALRDMNAATGIPIKDLVRLWRSESHPLDEKQAILLADFLGVEVSSLLAGLTASVAPAELVDVMNRPTHKSLFHHYAHEWELDEAQTRRQMARKLVATKKRARELSPDDWERLLVDYFPL